MNIPYTPDARSEVGGREGWTKRKSEFYASAQSQAPRRRFWIERNASFYADDLRYMRFLVPPRARVLDLGCGDGRLLDALSPSYGVGVDFSPAMIEQARTRFPDLEFHLGDIEDRRVLAELKGPYDVIVLSDTIGMLDDIEQTLKQLHPLCDENTRIIIAHHSAYWEPLLNLAEKIGRRMPQPRANLLSTTDFVNLLKLADLEPIRMEWRQLLPLSLAGVGRLLNRFVAPLPLIRNFCLRAYVVSRSLRAVKPRELSTTVLIPCRNEMGNIERAIREMPRFGSHQEIIFVEGNSKDGTYEECLRVKDAYSGVWDIRVLKQLGRGKGDAVRRGFDVATQDILMILDADLTVPAADLRKFYDVVASGKAEFVNGTRLVYPMENDAMRFLNHIANRFFAFTFSYLLNQRFTDTLCGTKVLRREHYVKLVRARSYFGEFDPFGDFDLIFGAAKLNLQFIEVPVTYKARTYGSTQISRFRDGWLLIKMVLFAYRKLKAI